MYKSFIRDNFEYAILHLGLATLTRSLQKTFGSFLTQQ